MLNNSYFIWSPKGLSVFSYTFMFDLFYSTSWSDGLNAPYLDSDGMNRCDLFIRYPYIFKRWERINLLVLFSELYMIQGGNCVFKDVVI